MGRPRKHVRDPEVPARSFNEIQAIVEMALTLFRLIGGDSLDLQLRSLDRTAEMYQLQTDAALQYGQDPGAFGPTVTPYEARMGASTYARLHAQREKKMAQCMAWAEEGAQAAAERKAAGAVAATNAEPEASANGGEAAPTKPAAAAEPSEVVEAARAQAQPKDGDPIDELRAGSPSVKVGREQSPAPEEFCDAPKQAHPEALTTRIAHMLTGLKRD